MVKHLTGTTVNELYAFIGVHIYMGFDRLAELKDYWSKNFQHPFVTSIFTPSSCYDTFEFTPLDSASHHRDPMTHVRLLIEELNKSFKIFCPPAKEMAYDESIVALCELTLSVLPSLR